MHWALTFSLVLNLAQQTWPLLHWNVCTHKHPVSVRSPSCCIYTPAHTKLEMGLNVHSCSFLTVSFFISCRLTTANPCFALLVVAIICFIEHSVHCAQFTAISIKQKRGGNISGWGKWLMTSKEEGRGGGTYGLGVPGFHFPLIPSASLVLQRWCSLLPLLPLQDASSCFHSPVSSPLPHPLPPLCVCIANSNIKLW